LTLKSWRSKPSFVDVIVDLDGDGDGDVAGCTLSGRVSMA